MKLEDINNEIQNQKILEYILQKFSNKLYEDDHLYYVITTDGEVHSLNDFVDLKDSNPNTPPAFIFIINQWVYSKSDYPVLYYCPFLKIPTLIADTYLETYYYNSPIYQIKYIAIITHFTDTKEIVIEVADVETIAKNMGMEKLVQQVFGHKNMNEEYEDEDVIDLNKVEEFENLFKTEKLFYGYDFYLASELIDKYYKENDKTLAEVVKNIEAEYKSRIQPDRLVLSLKNETIK